MNNNRIHIFYIHIKSTLYVYRWHIHILHTYYTDMLHAHNSAPASEIAFSVYIYVNMYTCIYVCIYICMYMYMHMHIHMYRYGDTFYEYRWRNTIGKPGASMHAKARSGRLAEKHSRGVRTLIPSVWSPSFNLFPRRSRWPMLTRRPSRLRTASR